MEAAFERDGRLDSSEQVLESPSASTAVGGTALQVGLVYGLASENASSSCRFGLANSDRAEGRRSARKRQGWNCAAMGTASKMALPITLPIASYVSSIAAASS